MVKIVIIDLDDLFQSHSLLLFNYFFFVNTQKQQSKNAVFLENKYFETSQLLYLITLTPVSITTFFLPERYRFI